MINGVKEFITKNEKNIIIGILLLAGFFFAYDMFGTKLPNNGSTAKQIKSELGSVGIEFNATRQAITNSQGITREIRTTNTNIQQSNNTARESIIESESINQSSHELIRSCKQIITDTRAGN